jgi:hypothetical protein
VTVTGTRVVNGAALLKVAALKKTTVPMLIKAKVLEMVAFPLYEIVKAVDVALTVVTEGKLIRGVKITELVS